MPGGMLYEKLKQKPIREILQKYHELKALETKPEYVIAKLGAWIMDNPDFNPVITEMQPPTILDEFFSKILDTWHRIKLSKFRTNEDTDTFKGTFEDNQMRTNLEIQSEKTFILTAQGFNLIKKSFGYAGSAENFARSYNFGYKSARVDEYVHKCIVGEIPDQYIYDDKTSGKKTQDSKPENKEPAQDNKPEQYDESEQDKEPETDDETEQYGKLTPEEKQQVLDKILG